MTNDRKFVTRLVVFTLAFFVTTAIAHAQVAKRRHAGRSVRTASTGSTTRERVDRFATKLNRATALTLIQEGGTPGISKNWDLNLILDVSPSSPPEELARLEFCNALVSAGILKRRSIEEFDRSFYIFTNGRQQVNERGQRYLFDVVDMPGVTLGSWGDMPLANFDLSSFGSVTQITRIYQEEGSARAMAWAIVVIQPSPLYMRLKTIVDRISAKYGPTLYQYEASAWTAFPDIEWLSKQSEDQYGFIRYDDGWRCCR